MEWIRHQLKRAMFVQEQHNYFYFLYPFQMMAGYPTSLRSAREKVGMGLRFIIYLVYMVSGLHKLSYAIYQPEDMNYYAFVGGATGVMIGYLMLLVFGVRYNDIFGQMKDFFNNHSFARTHPMAGGIRQRCYRWANLFILVPQIGVVLVNIQIVVLKQYAKKHMMLVVQGEPVGSAFIQVLYCAALYVPSVGFFMACAIVNACLVGIVGEMKLLAICLGELDETVARRLTDQGGEKSRKDFWMIYLGELRRCAKRHCELFLMLTNIQQFSSFIFLLHHVFSLCLVVAGSYVTLRENALHENIIFFEYPIPLVFMYFTFCQLVENIQDMNTMIGERLYATEWMLQLRYSPQFQHEYRSAVRTIEILLWRSKQRIRFTCGSINEISMAKFTDFLNLNYTVVMFLISLN